MARQNSLIENFDPNNVPVGYPGIKVSEIRTAINTRHTTPMIAEGSTIGLKDLRTYQYNTCKANEQPGTNIITHPVKMSQFRSSNILGIDVKVKNESYGGAQDDGEVHVTITHGSGGVYRAALFCDRSEPSGATTYSGGLVQNIDLNPLAATMLHWDDVAESDKFDISSTFSFTVKRVGIASNQAGTYFPYYRLFINDETAATTGGTDNMMWMQMTLMIGIDWQTSGGTYAKPRYNHQIGAGTARGNIAVPYETGWLDFPNWRWKDFSDAVSFIHPGRDGIA
jgi:hypothetical protein